MIRWVFGCPSWIMAQDSWRSNSWELFPTSGVEIPACSRQE